MAAERDGARAEARKLQKRLECLQGDLRLSKQRNTELKAQLSHTEQIKVEGTRAPVRTKPRGLFTA